MNDRFINIENKLADIQKTLNTLAVQNEQISSLQKQHTNLWKKYDILTEPKDGIISKLQTFQASCPRKTFQDNVKWTWAIIIPLILTQIGIAIELLSKK